MTSDDLATAQAKQLGVIVGRYLRYMGKLRTRMEGLGFTATDPLYRSVCQAYDGLHAVCVHAHYASIKSAMNRPQ